MNSFVKKTIIILVVHGGNHKCDFFKDITSQQINEEKIRKARASQRFSGLKGIKPKPIHWRKIGR
jgi:hypothetical protein